MLDPTHAATLCWALVPTFITLSSAGCCGVDFQPYYIVEMGSTRLNTVDAQWGGTTSPTPRYAHISFSGYDGPLDLQLLEFYTDDGASVSPPQLAACSGGYRPRPQLRTC